MNPERSTAQGIMETVQATGLWKPDLGGSDRLLLLVEELLRWNEKMHIVSRCDSEGALASQVVESLSMLKFALEVDSEGRENGRLHRSGPEYGRIADIGSGYGFPALVWKAANDKLPLTLIERKEKAATFLELLCARMGFEGVEVVCGDASKHPEAGFFSMVVSKAAGRLGWMLPVAGRLLARGGCYITVKGADWREELEGLEDCGLTLHRVEGLPGQAGALLSFLRL